MELEVWEKPLWAAALDVQLPGYKRVRVDPADNLAGDTRATPWSAVYVREADRDHPLLLSIQRMDSAREAWERVQQAPRKFSHGGLTFVDAGIGAASCALDDFSSIDFCYGNWHVSLYVAGKREDMREASRLVLRDIQAIERGE